MVRNNDLEMPEIAMDNGSYINNIKNVCFFIWEAYKRNNKNMVKLHIRHRANSFINDT